jgi:uncharacterized protein (UPF0261 family)
MNKTIAILGAMDTKGSEYGFVKDLIQKEGLDTLVIDTGIINPPLLKPDISRHELTKAIGKDFDMLMKKDSSREAMTPILSDGAKKVIKDLVSKNKIHGIIALGGTQGTTSATNVMRDLPVGFPKVMVSTIASGNTLKFVDIKDITMLNSVADILGLNRVTRQVLREAAGAICGMVRIDKEKIDTSKKLIALTNVGITTPGAMKAKEFFEEAGFETIVFHAVGTGGRAMESLIKEGQVDGVFDLATIEVMQQLTGGILASNSERMTVAGSYGIPQVIAPGGIPVTTFSPHESIPEHLKDRKYVRHNPMFTNVLNNKEEFVLLAREQAKRVNGSKGPIEWFIPMKGFCSYSKEGEIFYDRESNEAYVEVLKKELRPDIPVNILQLDINHPDFVLAMAERLLDLMKK